MYRKLRFQLQVPEIPKYVTEESNSYRDYVVEIAKYFGIAHYRVLTELDNFLKFQQMLFDVKIFISIDCNRK